MTFRCPESAPHFSRPKYIDQVVSVGSLKFVSIPSRIKCFQKGRESLPKRPGGVHRTTIPDPFRNKVIPISTVPNRLVVPASAGKSDEFVRLGRSNFRLKAGPRTKCDSRTIVCLLVPQMSLLPFHLPFLSVTRCLNRPPE